MATVKISKISHDGETVRIGLGNKFGIEIAGGLAGVKDWARSQVRESGWELLVALAILRTAKLSPDFRRADLAQLEGKTITFDVGDQNVLEVA